MSSISSRSLSMSSLIFLPFFAISGLADAPSPPPSLGLVGRVSFFFCSAMWPLHRACTRVARQVVTPPRLHSNPNRHPLPRKTRESRAGGSAPEVLAQPQRLALVRGGQADPVGPLGPAAGPAAPDLAGRRTAWRP